jgi:hypothetical protein
VKTFFNDSTPAMGSSTRSSTQRLNFLLTVVYDITERERSERPAHNS